MEENSSFVSYTNDTTEDTTDVVARSHASHSLARVWWGLAIGAVLAGGSLALTISASGFSITCVVIALFLFAFGASLPLEDSAAREVMYWMCTKSISFPGLIWEFSIDGFLWLIGMKLLFWVLGVIGGILFAIIGVILGILVAPFAYPFNLVSFIKDGD